MEGIRIELADCEGVLLREIAEPEITRKSLSLTYAFALKSSERDRIKWGKVNRAIVNRWSAAGLNWIKTRAWKLVEGKIQP